MKVLLLQHIPSLGRKFDIANVKDGYALNYLFPRKLAKAADETSIREIEERKKRELIKKEESAAFSHEIAEKIKDLKQITLSRKTSTKDHLFAAVGKKDIVEAIASQLHVELALENIVMKEHIKTLGEHEVTISVSSTKTPLIVNVLKSEEKK